MTENSVSQDNEKYRGLRALEFLRVSSAEQKKMYGWPRQHAEIERKLIQPLNLRVIHTIEDSYTGLDFEMHDALDLAHDMAKKRKYDLFLVDTLDRLGRKGIEREIYLLELRQEGVRVLSADPDDHSDDETSWGELIRYLKGKEAEREVNNIKHRTMGGRRAKAMGDPSKGIPPMLICGGHLLYGYKWVTNEKGRKIGTEPNFTTIIHVSPDGTEWNGPEVIKFMFELSADGTSIKNIAKMLNEMGIPSPYMLKGIQRKTGWTKIWQPSAVARMLGHKGYAGEVTLFKEKVVGKIISTRKPGTKVDKRQKTDPSEQVTILIPAVISMELFEQVQAQLGRNKEKAARNNKDPERFLLRAGLVRCGYCNSVMSGRSRAKWLKGGQDQLGYLCRGRYGMLGKCETAAYHDARSLDAAAWKKVTEIIRYPEQVDAYVAELRKEDPTADNRKKINAKIKDIQQQQGIFRTQLRDLMLKGTLDKGTEEFLTNELRQLVEREQEWNTKLIENEDVKRKWKEVDDKLTEIHERCESLRDKLDDPNYEASYQEKRELLEFFNIQVTVWQAGHKPRFKIKANPVGIATTLL